jgi:hypothetical protein
VAFTNGTFALFGSTLRGCLWSDRAYAADVPTDAVPSATGALSDTFKICEWSALEYAVDVPAVPVLLSIGGI